MNYEDRTDLEPPQALLHPDTIEALSRAWRSVDDKFAAAFDSAPRSLGPATEGLLREVIRPETELKGAPPEARPVGLNAALAGYRLATAMLGIAGSDENRDEVVARVHRMYVHDLYSGLSDGSGRLLQSKLMQLIVDAGAPRRGDFEVHANLCFALGLAAAVVESDLRPRS